MAYERTWANVLNSSYSPSSALDLTRYEMFALKAMLKGELGGLTLGLWTCAGSSDSSVGAMDGVDRWTASYDGSKIVRGAAGANPKSWIVLTSPATLNGNTFHLLIGFESAADTTVILKIAKTAFTGGDSTTLPTSVDEWSVGTTSTGSETWNGGSTATHRFNFGLSSLGDFYWFVVQTGVAHPVLGVIVMGPVGTNGVDLFPIYTFKYYHSLGAFQCSRLCTASVIANPRTLLYNGNAGFMQILSSDGTYCNTVVDSITNSQMDLPAWVICGESTSSGIWHARGRLPDVGVIPPSGAATKFASGTAVREDGNVKWVSAGCLWLPANDIVVI